MCVANQTLARCACMAFLAGFIAAIVNVYIHICTPAAGMSSPDISFCYSPLLLWAIAASLYLPPAIQQASE